MLMSVYGYVEGMYAGILKYTGKSEQLSFPITWSKLNIQEKKEEILNSNSLCLVRQFVLAKTATPPSAKQRYTS